MEIIGRIVCLTISFPVQAAFVWLAAKVIRIDPNRNSNAAGMR